MDSRRKAFEGMIKQRTVSTQVSTRHYNRHNKRYTHQSPDDQRSQDSSNTSIPENSKSKKSKMFSKFSTFSKRKKPTDSAKDSSSPDHHPSENATNTYYKWQSEGPSNMDYNPKTDPFNFLYEQPSSLSDIHNIHNRAMNTEPVRTRTVGTHFDSITIRKTKNRSNGALREKQPVEQTPAVVQEISKPEPRQLSPKASHSEGDEEKFRTITINSFRKSFRERLLQQKNDAPHNPAWFVEVEEPPARESSSSPTRTKENRSDVLIFANENYKPLIHSPVRDHKSNTLRPSMRSSVKRNETFRVERQLLADKTPLSMEEPTPSIRIEIKNSITSNGPGRMVPVGVAKPMPSSSSSSSPTTNSYKLRMTDGTDKYAPTPFARTDSFARTEAKHKNNVEPNDWLKPVAGHSVIANVSPKKPSHEGRRYQTLVEIRSDSAVDEAKRPSLPSLHSYRIEPLRIQLSSDSTRSAQPPLQYRHQASSDSTRSVQAPLQYRQQHSAAKNTQDANAQTPSLARFESSTSNSSFNSMKPVTKTYFGDNSQRLQYSSSGGYKPRSPQGSGRCTPAAATGNKNQIRTAPHLDPKRSSSSSVNQHQRRSMTTTATSTTTMPAVTQRLSRSPIKIPWR